MPPYTVAVRALCEFTAKAGSLDVRFTPSPSAQQGMAGHALVAGRRSGNYQREVSLQAEYRGLRVRGRADGYDAAANRIEEIKTHRGTLERMPENHRHLHWAQVKIYGALLCAQKQLAEVELALVYFNIVSTEETVLAETFSAAALQDYFAAQCARFFHWAATEFQHRTRRDGFLRTVRFPYPALRSSQRDLAECVYKSAVCGQSLLAQAPTGIGKTIGTLFPLLKAAPAQGLDKIFLLVAKTSARAGALQALRAVVANVGSLRVLEYVSKASACEYPGSTCSGDSCPLAKGFYDRLPAARAAAAEIGFLDEAALRAEAARHQVCPYYLGQEMAKWCDVIVGDYNYYFDSSASLYAQTVANQWRVAVLVDEAHNLVARARAMYSAALHPASFEAARAAAPASLEYMFAALQRAWQDSYAAQDSPYRAYAVIPPPLRHALQNAVSAIAEHFGEDPGQLDAYLQNFYFEALYFAKMAEGFGSHSLFDISIEETQLLAGAPRGPTPRATLSIRNVAPAIFLAKRFSQSVTNVLFSATLGPPRYYRQLLGLPASTGWVDVRTPFSPEQLEVRVSRGISTRYRDRGASAASIVGLIARQYFERPGNYLAFFSSFEYASQMSMYFRRMHPLIPVREQTRDMDSMQRRVFLEQFTDASRGIAFAVLGGAFAEGVDLPGSRLIGAFIATLGLPQINSINRQLELRMQDLFGAGYEYTYLYPGLQKVVQAAGRVIRTPEDRGTIHLMDDRFMLPAVRALLPQWWQVQ